MKKFEIKENFMRCDAIAISYQEYGHSEEIHTHDAIEIGYVVKGNGEQIVNDNVMWAKDGSFIIMDHSCSHSMRVFETVRYYNIMFKESFLKETCADYAGLKKLLKEYYNFDFTQDFLCVEFKDDKAKKRIEELFFGMLDEGLHKRERYEEIMHCYLDAIINIALRNYKEEHYGKVDVFMEEIISSVEKNCDQPLLLEDLAKKYNYNPRYLSNRLKEYCGLSFKQLLIKKRLDNVIYLMLTTEDSIDTIIRKAGFTNKTYFYSIFEKNYGIKPKFVREYRNNFRNYLELRTQHNDLLTGDVKKVRITKK